jgi:hypothetical protein
MTASARVGYAIPSVGLRDGGIVLVLGILPL